MQNQADRDNLYANFSQIVDFAKKLLLEFENIFGDRLIIERAPNIEIVYMQLIVINLAKIFSSSKNEPFRLGQFKNICRRDIKERIENIEINHQDIIAKINNNRNKIIGHLDRNFTEMLFSIDYTMMLKKVFKTDFSKIKATSKENERYVPIDIKNDLVEIRKLLEEMDKIWKEVLLSDHNKK